MGLAQYYSSAFVGTAFVFVAVYRRENVAFPAMRCRCVGEDDDSTGEKHTNYVECIIPDSQLLASTEPHRMCFYRHQLLDIFLFSEHFVFTFFTNQTQREVKERRDKFVLRKQTLRK